MDITKLFQNQAGQTGVDQDCADCGQGPTNLGGLAIHGEGHQDCHDDTASADAAAFTAELPKVTGKRYDIVDVTVRARTTIEFDGEPQLSVGQTTDVDPESIRARFAARQGCEVVTTRSFASVTPIEVDMPRVNGQMTFVADAVADAMVDDLQITRPGSASTQVPN